MFKKPLADLKTSAPLRSSDRRKLKQRISEAYSLTAEIGELLVPDGLLSQKFSTHVNEHGVAYLSQEGDPLWFSLGRSSTELIPTVYTLWKHPMLLPTLSTPAAVVPKLVGGADLMIPGVIQHAPSLVPEQIVAITQFYPQNKIGPPIAVGRMAVPSSSLERGDLKGKAVLVLHTWKDHLWEMGNRRKDDPPEPKDTTSEPTEMERAGELDDENSAPTKGVMDEPPDTAEGGEVAGGTTSAEPGTQPTQVPSLTPEEVSTYLRGALLQTLSTSLSSTPPSTFPISASSFWTSYVLPARQAYIQGPQGIVEGTTIDVKQSTHKSVKTFLKASAKEGLIKLKEVKGDVVVTAVYPSHPSVASHRPYRSIQSLEAKKEKTGERDRKEKEAEEKRKGELRVVELWKPHQRSLPWFVSAQKDTSHLYSIVEIKDVFNAYVSSKGLINPRDQQYINVGEDPPLLEAVFVKNEDSSDFMKRDDALKRIRANMQSWHEVGPEGGDPIRKKGSAKPISVVVKLRQGRKAATLVTGFEQYLLQADDLAEELRKLCASSTSVAPLPGKSSDMEVMVQGKQIKVVTDLLVSKGVPRKWIETADLTENKKK